MIDAESDRCVFYMHSDTRLQWGRVVIDAESVGDLEGGVPLGLLQWGRVVIDAESLGDRSRERYVGRFNGAAS